MAFSTGDQAHFVPYSMTNSEVALHLHAGQTATVIGQDLRNPDMYRVEFPDGFTCSAFAEELTAL